MLPRYELASDFASEARVPKLRSGIEPNRLQQLKSQASDFERLCYTILKRPITLLPCTLPSIQQSPKFFPNEETR